MSIVLPNRFVYLDTPRTASTATQLALRLAFPESKLLEPRHLTLDQVKERCKLSGLEVIFTCVRNPLDLFATWVCLFNLPGTPQEQMAHFLDNKLENDYMVRKGRLFWHKAQYVIHYENLEVELSEMVDKRVPVPRVNVTKGKAPYLDYYTRDTMLRVQEMFWMDFELGGYQ